MLDSEIHDLSDDADYAASLQQGSASVMLCNDSTKESSSASELDGAEVVYWKDNVAIHPTQFAISGRLKLIKQGSSLFMTWIPYKGHNADTGLSDKDRNLYTIRAVPFTEIRSIRRHTPALGWQYIIVVLSSGLAYPPLYFYSGGVKEFLATIKQHVLLVRSAEDANVFLVNDFQSTLQRTLSSLELPRAVPLARGPSNMSLDESTLNENEERNDNGVNNGSVSVPQFHRRPRQKAHDPARDLSIQVLEKFSLVTKFARETTSQLFRENQTNGFSTNERRTQIQNNLDPPKSSNVAGKISDENSAVPDSQEFDNLSLVWGKPRQSPLDSKEWITFLDSEGRVTDSEAMRKRIFYGGLDHELRNEVWGLLLGYYTYDSTYAEREFLKSVKKSEYENIKNQWQSISPAQAKRFTKFRERKGLIEKDVVRTDRSISFYEGDDNPNVNVLRDILLTYSFYNFDLGYCQGMSDLLSPILFVMNDESEAFWCFVALIFLPPSMATAAVFRSLLRRSRTSSLLYLPRVLTSHPHPLTPHSSTHASLDAFRTRAFSTHSFNDRESETESINLDSPVHPEILKAVADSAGAGGEDSPVFPIRAVISLLESYHDLTGFPWWITIVSSTLALRIVMLFPLVFTLHKLKRIAEFAPKLPPPFPPPFSGKSYMRQMSFFEEKRKAIGCPSYAWPLVPFMVQIPCFFLWMISIRRMSLDGHPGFDCGGALWFQNLTEFSHGYSGFTFPFLMGSLHYIIVQVSFKKPLVEETKDIFGLLSTYYKRYLDFLTVPIAFIGFCIPQGSQLYWITNSSLTLVQHFALRNPTILAKLGLLDKNRQKAASGKIGASETPRLQDNSTIVATKENVSPEKNPLDSPEKWQKIPIENMSPVELTTLAVPFLSSNDKESAIPLLKLALDKDPEYLRALVLMGRVLLLKQINDEAVEYFERAISKLSLAGLPTDPEEVDFLILSSQWAGIACERQGKKEEGRVHFERVANMEEPEDPTSKGYYFDGLLLLASTLYDAGQKAEAAKYLRLVVAYNPGYKKFLEQCEQHEDLTSDLARSRREL